MLVLSRKVGEQIVIGDGIVVTVVEVHGGTIRLGIEAPASVPIWRQELLAAGKPARPKSQPVKARRGQDNDRRSRLASDQPQTAQVTDRPAPRRTRLLAPR